LSRLDGRISVAPARRVVTFGPRAGRVALQGVGYWQGRPCLVLEEGERTTVLLRFDSALGKDDTIVGVGLSTAGAKAKAAFDERSIAIEVWNSRVWFWDVVGYDYGFQRSDFIELAVRFSNGEDMRWRMLVRAPNRSEVYSVRVGNGDVVDMRRAPASPDAPPVSIDPANIKTADPAAPYVESEFGDEFGGGFGS